MQRSEGCPLLQEKVKLKNALRTSFWLSGVLAWGTSTRLVNWNYETKDCCLLLLYCSNSSFYSPCVENKLQAIDNKNNQYGIIRGSSRLHPILLLSTGVLTIPFYYRCSFCHAVLYISGDNGWIKLNITVLDHDCLIMNHLQLRMAQSSSDLFRKYFPRGETPTIFKDPNI